MCCLQIIFMQLSPYMARSELCMAAAGKTRLSANTAGYKLCVAVQNNYSDMLKQCVVDANCVNIGYNTYKT